MNFHYSTALQRPLPPSKSPKSQQLNRGMLQVKQVFFVYSGWVTNTDAQHFLIRSVNCKLFHNSLICMDLRYTPPPSQTCLTTVQFDHAGPTAIPSDDDDEFLSFLNAVQNAHAPRAGPCETKLVHHRTALASLHQQGALPKSRPSKRSL